MKTRHFKTASRFVEFLRLSHERWEPPWDWGFRGQHNARWPLRPSLLRGPKGREAWRSYCDDHVYYTRAAILAAESMVMEQFVREADQHGLSIPSFHLDDYWTAVQQAMPALERPQDPAEDPLGEAELSSVLLRLSPDRVLANVGLAQHYGCPTRLLDWTAKPLVAAYFAAKGACATGYGRKRAQTGNLAVFALDRGLVTIMQEGQSEDPAEIAIVTAPQATNPNLAAQAAFFVLDRLNRGMPLEKLVDRLAKKHRYLPEPLYKLTLPKSQAPKLLRILADEGVSAASVFPGYDGVTEAIFERALFHDARKQVRERWELRRSRY